MTGKIVLGNARLSLYLVVEYFWNRAARNRYLLESVPEDWDGIEKWENK